MKIGRFAFLRPPLGDLWATYDDHLRLIGKRVVSQFTRVTDRQKDRQNSPRYTASALHAAR